MAAAISAGTAGLIAAGVSAAGAIGGAAINASSSSSSKGINLAAPSALQGQAGDVVSQGLTDMGNLVNAGPGAADVTAGSQSQRDLATMLQNYQNGGNVPNAADISQGNKFAASAFAPQQTALNQSYIQQNQQYAQQAAIQGRSALDPTVRAEAMKNQTMQQQQLTSQQGAFANQWAMQQPMQQLGFAQQRASVLGGLATQAMSNRQALTSMGSQIQAQQQNYQLGASGSTQQTQGASGGGFGQAIAGGISGLGAGLNAVSSYNKMQGSAPSAPSSFSLGGASSSPSGPSLGVNTSFGPTPSFSF